MAIHKSSVVLLLALTGAASTFLLGCRLHHRGLESEYHSDGGALTISKMGGEIDVDDAPRGATLSTMGGDIRLGSVGEFAKVKTMGGNVTVDNAEGSVDATTMGGNVTLKSVNGAIKATTMGGDVTARMVGASDQRRDIELSSLGGTITLTVPKDFSMDVRIKLAYTKNANRTFDIIQHVGLNQRESEDWDTSQGTPRKYIYAEGRVGSGLNHVEIKTINGDVILKQE
jgi:DUF4097 and DUF4098 domain-containing protein YvlB